MIRGARLMLCRGQFSGRDQNEEAYQWEPPGFVEIDAEERITAFLIFDLDDTDPAFAELDDRYLAGEAAPYGHTWSVIVGALAAVNRHEIPYVTTDYVVVDHPLQHSNRSERPDQLSASVVRPHPGASHVHRVRASAERPRGGRHQLVLRNLTRRL